MARREHVSGFVDNWQNGKTLPECNLHMLETEDCCDVSFRVGSAGHVIKAHRYVLISRSCVFHVMFCGQMAEQGEIIIPDIEADVFKDFMRFLYTDKVVLTTGNAPGLLYTSRKYDVDALFTQCASFLENSLTEENVCEILENCHGYGEVDIEEKALRILTKSGEITLKSSRFKKLCLPCFQKFLTSDDLYVKEEDVFEATLIWAKDRCKEENIETSPENQRKILGNLIYHICFSAFSTEYLTTTVRKSQILTTEERMLLVDKKNNPDIDILPFSSTQRKERKTYHYVKRFKHGWAAQNGYDSNNALHSISFKTSKDIKLAGCQIYGAVKFTESNYVVTLRIYNDEEVIISEPYTSATVTLTGKKGLSDLMFPESVDIMSGQKYTLWVNLKGCLCNWGSKGVQRIEVESVTFNFNTSTLSETDNTRTNQNNGQIPGLIWRHW